MYWGIVGADLRVWFAVEDGKGLIKEGLVPTDFTVMVVSPDDSADVSPTVTESTRKPGLYRFDVPGAFLTTHGPDNYIASIEVNATIPKLNAVGGVTLKVDQETIDTIGANSELMRKTVTNRMEEFPGSPGQLVLWDDDGVTPLKTWTLRDVAGGGIVGVPGAPAKRGTAT